MDEALCAWEDAVLVGVRATMAKPAHIRELVRSLAAFAERGAKHGGVTLAQAECSVLARERAIEALLSERARDAGKNVEHLRAKLHATARWLARLIDRLAASALRRVQLSREEQARGNRARVFSRVETRAYDARLTSLSRRG